MVAEAEVKESERASTSATVLPPATRRERTVLPMMAFLPGFLK